MNRNDDFKYTSINMMNSVGNSFIHEDIETNIGCRNHNPTQEIQNMKWLSSYLPKHNGGMVWKEN